MYKETEWTKSLQKEVDVRHDTEFPNTTILFKGWEKNKRLGVYALSFSKTKFNEKSVPYERNGIVVIVPILKGVAMDEYLLEPETQKKIIDEVVYFDESEFYDIQGDQQ